VFALLYLDAVENYDQSSWDKSSGSEFFIFS